MIPWKLTWVTCEKYWNIDDIICVMWPVTSYQTGGGRREGQGEPILYQSHLQINWIYHIFDTTNGEYYTVLATLSSRYIILITDSQGCCRPSINTSHTDNILRRVGSLPAFSIYYTTILLSLKHLTTPIVDKNIMKCFHMKCLFKRNVWKYSRYVIHFI